jgi:hypothetical protein
VSYCIHLAAVSAFCGRHHGGDGEPRRIQIDAKEYGVAARLDAGAILDEVFTEDGRAVSVRYERCPAGWQAAFELSQPGVDDLAVVHRLVTDTLGQARASVPSAIAFLLGIPIDRPI